MEEYDFLKETNLTQVFPLLSGRSLLKLCEVKFGLNIDTKKKVSLATFKLQIKVTNLLGIPGAAKVQNEFVHKIRIHKRVRTE